MTENETVAALMEETRDDRFERKGDLGSKLTCGCCVDSEYVVEVVEPLLRRAFQAGAKPSEKVLELANKIRKWEEATSRGEFPFDEACDLVHEILK